MGAHKRILQRPGMWFNVREQVNAAYGDEMLARLENHVS